MGTRHVGMKEKTWKAGTLDATGWIGIGRWLSPDFSFSPFQGGNPVINALASLLLPIPSLRWLASLSFQKKWKKLSGGEQETADYSRKLFKTVFESEV
ncbi:hypothetical protein AB4Z30_00765 [Paenibacillus sp. 2TAF8]|uniref:hypothetical protein n=1 Tax=Paenibacillus sp. 2TAF8 TaxID=3233020 RepID=UPI003F9BA7D9